MRFKNTPKTFWAKVAILPDTDACWVWQAGTNQGGYGIINFHCHRQLAHRVAYQLTYGDLPNDLMVLHECDNPPCCNPKHLFLGTRLDNMIDKVNKGRATHGEGINNAKLTDESVREIRRKYAEGGITMVALSNEYNVHQSEISRIVNGRAWKRVLDET